MNRRGFVSSICGATLLSALDSRGIAGALQPGASVGQRLWPRPTIFPVPEVTSDVTQPVVNLAGTWKFTLNPPERFWENGVDSSAWQDIQVPGECVTQGFAISRDSEYPFKRRVLIPADFRGKRTILRFDGVYSYARLWVNGTFVREHHGGFTTWEADITDSVTPGEPSWITLGVTDRGDEISYGSHYAKHSIGGILRDVRLIAVPATHLARLHATTDLDKSYSDALLEVTAAVSFGGGRTASVRLQLEDSQNRQVPLTPSSIALTPADTERTVRISVSAPRHWDAEHPYLYTLKATLVVDNVEGETVSRKLGFRKVELSGNRLLVNGKEVKLRGVCRHSIHPLHGRSTPSDIDERDAILLRDANVNFVRTSHYPPTERFLEACDRYGIYVEEETAVCFQLKETGSTSDPDYTSRFLNQFAEMIERDRSHPAVIFWSLGNESRWGQNIAKEYAYAKQEDTTRPVIFSYPDTIPVGTSGYDLFSMHYPQFDGELRSPHFPKLNDEYAHISCYNLETLRRDPGVRNFWGESLKRFWENCFASDGCLGGAIWAGFDEVFLLPDAAVGYGYWGIVDGWRRQKPEYWLTRKAYSPIRVPDTEMGCPADRGPLSIPVRNWFDHTNFNELKIEWQAGGDSGTIQGFHLAPHSQGTLTIPARSWKNGDTVKLKFYRAGGDLVDEHDVAIGKPVRVFPKTQEPAPTISADANSIAVAGKDFRIVFSKATGIITQGIYRGVTLIEGGPYLNLGLDNAAQWWLEKISYTKTNQVAIVSLSGQSMSGVDTLASVDFEVKIDGAGLITTIYRITSHPAKLNELGVGYLLSSSIDRLSWDRKALWTAYPADHIGRSKGLAVREGGHGSLSYRTEPAWPWSLDIEDHFLFGPKDAGGRGTCDFRSTKENIWYASCISRGGNLRIRAESAGLVAARAEVRHDGRVLFNLSNVWGYPDLAWGNYMKHVAAPVGYTNEIAMRMVDNDESDVLYE
jgi:Glycosyl hydrolases family 2, TIM barrel domain/Glycosyl hydrolases family 2/Glycosyl hydrolases family 2, sugar binding domain